MEQESHMVGTHTRACTRLSRDSIKSAIRRTIICLHRRCVLSRQKTPLFLSREYWGDNFVEGFARVIARSWEVSGVLGQSNLPSPPNFSSFKININIDIFISLYLPNLVRFQYIFIICYL